MTKLTHVPVLLEQTIAMLNVIPNGTYIDCTAGFGGHSAAVASLLSEKGTLLAIDHDDVAVAATAASLNKAKAKCLVAKGNFGELKAIAQKNGIGFADGIIYDLGVSSMQLDDPARGFSYANKGPLDMRMNQSQTRDAAQFVNEATKTELVSAFRNYADSSIAPRIAQAIIAQRPIHDTATLAEVIEQAIPAALRFKSRHPAQKYFQAIRMVVNNEVDVLEKSLDQARDLLKPGGRICVITFHSLEDKIVKRAFINWSRPDVPKEVPVLKTERSFTMIHPHGILPTEQEIKANSRARSARLRVVERTAAHV